MIWHIMAYFTQPGCLSTPKQSPDCLWGAAYPTRWAKIVPGMHQQLNNVALLLPVLMTHLVLWYRWSCLVCAFVNSLQCCYIIAREQGTACWVRQNVLKTGACFDKHLLANGAPLWSWPKTSCRCYVGQTFHFFFLLVGFSTPKLLSCYFNTSLNSYCKGTKPFTCAVGGQGNYMFCKGIHVL